MRKGITPVVAIILLLLITVAIVGFAFGFFQRATTTSAQRTQEETERIAGSVSEAFRIENAAGTSITIRNLGSAALNASTVTFYANGVARTCVGLPATIAVNGVGSCTLSASCTGQTLRVVTTGAEDVVTCD